MYDESVRQQALALLESGMTPREASARMGGKPGHAIIRRWAKGYVPQGKRGRGCVVTLEQKLLAIERVDAGEWYQAVADELGCAPATLLTWRRLYREGGKDALRTRIDRYLDTRGDD